jgi:hypothetical protein
MKRPPLEQPAAPARPCSECGVRQWRPRTTPPTGGWECGPCQDREEALLSARIKRPLVETRQHTAGA